MDEHHVGGFNQASEQDALNDGEDSPDSNSPFSERSLQ